MGGCVLWHRRDRGVQGSFLHLTLRPPNSGPQHEPRALDWKPSTLGDPTGRQGEKKGEIRGHRGGPAGHARSPRPPPPVPSAPAPPAWGCTAAAWGQWEGRVLQHSAWGPRDTTLWRAGDTAPGPCGGGAPRRQEEGLHPHPRGRANLLAHACVVSLPVPPVILRLYSKLLKLTYI